MSTPGNRRRLQAAHGAPLISFLSPSSLPSCFCIPPGAQQGPEERRLQRDGAGVPPLPRRRHLRLQVRHPRGEGAGQPGTRLAPGWIAGPCGWQPLNAVCSFALTNGVGGSALGWAVAPGTLSHCAAWPASSPHAPPLPARRWRAAAAAAHVRRLGAWPRAPWPRSCCARCGRAGGREGARAEAACGGRS